MLKATLFFIGLLASAVAAQPFVAPDASMTPRLTQGQGYTIATTTADNVLYGAVVVFPYNSQQVARLIVGVPESKQIAQDADFVVRATWRWDFWSDVENVQVWMQGDPPVQAPMKKADLVAADILLEVPLSDYEAAESLGDSLFYVHALNRPAIADGATRTAAQGADSREFGPVHFDDFVGVIQTE